MAKRIGMFRARRGKQGMGAWGAEEHARHEKGLKLSRKKSRFAKQLRRGGID